MVEPVELHVGQELILDLPGADVVGGEDAVVGAGGDVGGPDQVADHHQVLQRLVSGGVVGRLPQLLAVARRPGRHPPVVAREQDHVPVNQHARPGAGVNGNGGLGRFALPADLAVGAAEADELFTIVEDDAVALGRHRARGHGVLRLPESLAALGLVGQHAPRLGRPRPQAVGVVAVGPDVRVLAAPLGQARLGAVGHRQQHIVAHENLPRVLAAGVRENGLARGRVQRRHRRLQVQGRVDAISHGDQPPHQVGRAALERPLPGVPGVHLSLPQEGAVESVSGDQPPLRGKLDGGGGALVEDVEQPAARRDQRGHRGHVVVMACPGRSGHPLQAARRADAFVSGHRVAARVVEVVRPLVDVARARLEGPLPGLALARQQNALGGQHPHRLILLDGCLRHDQVHRVVGVGQVVPVPAVGRDRPVQALRADVLSRGGQLRLVGLQAVHQQAVMGPQGGRQPALPAARVDDQPAGHARGLQDLARPVARTGSGRPRRQHAQKTRSRRRGPGPEKLPLVCHGLSPCCDAFGRSDEPIVSPSAVKVNPALRPAAPLRADRPAGTVGVTGWGAAASRISGVWP
ncbi:MAG: hypothetical protein BWX88_04426 [Planctomycetes bacterium ADurb.Bin126]|nr:MAG: hypothetical protein BWX88_04426 [Planctomycetes bacterium ADurb.Bin126]